MNRSATTRLFVETDLAAGIAVTLGREQAHYLRNVLRLEPGAVVALFNGRDGEWLAEIDALGKADGVLRPTKRTRAQDHALGPALMFAPVKKAALDYLVQKAVELGVSALHPVLSDRTNVGRVNLDRLRANVREAAEQCGRLTLPVITEPRPLTAAVAAEAGTGAVYWCAEAGDARPIAEALRDAAGEPAPVFLVGPEGGFSPSELDALRNNTLITPISLGPRILRAETAAVAALVCWQSVRGDWQARPPEKAG